MVQLAVLDRTRTAPPASPADGDRHLVASGATGLWAGWDLNVAFHVDGAWIRLVPRPGWLVWVVDEGAFLVWSGSSWASVGEPRDVPDSIFSLVNDADPTRKAVFSLASISTGQTRTYTLPNTSSELAILAGTQTFAGNKTFSGTLTASGGTATIGTSTGTATYGIGTGATTNGATKTVNIGTGGASGSNTVVNIGSATAGAGGTTVINTPTVTFANSVTQVGMPQANLTAQQLGLGWATADSFNRFSINTPAMLTDFYGLQAMVAREMFVAGECFVRLRPRRAEDGLLVPLQLQLLQSEMLPFEKTETAANGNRIRCGIEFDGIGRRVAYHFRRRHPGDSTDQGALIPETVRVPAADVLHIYRPIDAGQIRGLNRRS